MPKMTASVYPNHMIASSVNGLRDPRSSRFHEVRVTIARERASDQIMVGDAIPVGDDRSP